jgi:hypothetical protein
MADGSSKGQRQGTFTGADFKDKVGDVESGACNDFLDGLWPDKEMLTKPLFGPKPGLDF